MSEKSYGWIGGIAALAAVGIGGYLVYNWLKNNGVSAAVGTAENVLSQIPGTPIWGGNIIMQQVPNVANTLGNIWDWWNNLFGKSQPQYKAATYTSLSVTPLEVAYAPIQQAGAVSAYGPRTVSVAEKHAAIITTQPSPLLVAPSSFFQVLKPSIQAALLTKISPVLSTTYDVTKKTWR
jgi:hypothetical protein